MLGKIISVIVTFIIMFIVAFIGIGSTFYMLKDSEEIKDEEN